jgi:hypothetical protein
VPALLTLMFPIHSAHPCDKEGYYLPSSVRSRPQPQQPLDTTPKNPFHPFDDRLTFEFADFHFSEQQSSAAAINRALQLWAAQSAKNGFDDIPWKSANYVLFLMSKQHVPISMVIGTMFHLWNSTMQETMSGLASCLPTGLPSKLFVIYLYYHHFHLSNWIYRTRFLRIPIHMGPCSSVWFQGAIKP